MSRLLAALPVAILALAAASATPAAAQVAGVYAGTSSDGGGVNFTVATDPNTNVLAVTGAGVGFDATCSHSAPNLFTGWGYGMMQDIAHHRVTNTTTDPYFVIKFNLIFSTDGKTATGRVSSISPSLEPSGAAPKTASICKALNRTMTLTLQPPGAKVSPPVDSGKLHTVQSQ
jgi:hypothetical protein